MRRFALPALLAALALAQAGCGWNGMIMVHPRTGQRVECHGTREQVKACQERLQLEGYTVEGISPGTR